MIDTKIEELVKETVVKIKARGIEYSDTLLKLDGTKYSFIDPKDENHEYYTSLLDGQDSRDNITENNHISSTEEETIKVPKPFIYSRYDTVGTISQDDLNVIKKTAEFYVISSRENGDDDYLTTFKGALNDDDKFNFLETTHLLHPIFKDFVSQYEHVLSDSNEYSSQNEFLRQCFERAEYNEYTKQLEKTNKKTIDMFKIRFAAINWIKFNTLPKVDILFEPTNIEGSEPDLDSKFKAPLDFSKLRMKQISDSETKNYLSKYFNEETKDEILPRAEETKTTMRSETRGKKRKGKIVIKGKGETRISKKRK